MKNEDSKGFYAEQADLTMEDHLIFEYRFESFVDPEELASSPPRVIQWGTSVLSWKPLQEKPYLLGMPYSI